MLFIEGKSRTRDSVIMRERKLERYFVHFCVHGELLNNFF